MKVRQLENKNQFVMEDNKKIIFQSYESTIVVYNKDKKALCLVTIGTIQTQQENIYTYL